MDDFCSKSKIITSTLTIVVIVSLVVYFSQVDSNNDDQDINYDKLTLVDIIKKRGYDAEEHSVTTKDGYILTLTRILNPLIKRDSQLVAHKAPILFMPGETATGGMFVANSKNVQPKDFTNIDAKKLSLLDLEQSFENEPSAKSLALIASNFGRDIWLGSRRGYPTSQGNIDPNKQPFYKRTDKIGQTDDLVTSCCRSGRANEEEDCDPIESLQFIMNEYQKLVNRRYWNFTLDDEAIIDVGDSIDYILAKTGSKKLDLVGHSSGAAINLMVLIARPELQASISNLVLYAPTIYQSKWSRLALDAIEPALKDYIGPFSIPSVTSQVSCLIDRSCVVKYGSEKDDEGNLLAESCQSPQIIYMNQNGYPVGNKHTTQLLQNLGTRMHYYDYGIARNTIKYGKSEALLYDIHTIKVSKVSVYHGRYDTKITPKMAKMLIDDFTVPVEDHYFSKPELHFGHGDPLFHKDVARLVVIPSLKQIESN